MNKLYITIISLATLYSCQSERFPQGANIYKSLCSNCHMDDGSGLNKLIPSILESDKLDDPSSFTCLIIKGVNADDLGEEMNVMPGYPKLSDAQIVNLFHFVNHRFSDGQREVTMSEIGNLRKACQ